MQLTSAVLCIDLSDRCCDDPGSDFYYNERALYVMFCAYRSDMCYDGFRSNLCYYKCEVRCVLYLPFSQVLQWPSVYPVLQ